MMPTIRFASLGLTILALSAALMSLPTLLACSCAPPPPPAQALQQSAAVFLGKVVAIDDQPAGFSRTVTLTVEKWWKGGDADTIKVTTSTSGESCGFGFQKDGRYLVYTYLPKGSPLGNVSLCSRTSDAKSAQAVGDFEALGPGTAPKGKS